MMMTQTWSDYFSWDFIYSVYFYLRDFKTSRHPGNETLEGKTAIITGASSGIGKEVALDLARRGARVIITCRDPKRGKTAIDYICEKVPKADVIAKILDLKSLQSVRKFAKEILESEKQINILINNAGTLEDAGKTEDGFEVHFAVNYLGPFLLTNLLLERMKASAPARIVNVSSLLHMFASLDLDNLGMQYDMKSVAAYNQSKLCNILFTRELAKKLEGTGVTAFSLHPGAVNTGISRHGNELYMSLYRKMSEYFLLTPELGARTIIYCAVDETIEKDSGLYFCDCTPLKTSRLSRDEKVAEKLWNQSEKLVGLNDKSSEKIAIQTMAQKI